MRRSLQNALLLAGAALALAAPARATYNALVPSPTITGTQDGTNAVFTLPSVPSAGSEEVSLNGVRETVGADYTISGATITFLAGSIPQPGDRLTARYYK